MFIRKKLLSFNPKTLKLHYTPKGPDFNAEEKRLISTLEKLYTQFTTDPNTKEIAEHLLKSTQINLDISDPINPKLPYPFGFMVKYKENCPSITKASAQKTWDKMSSVESINELLGSATAKQLTQYEFELLFHLNSKLSESKTEGERQVVYLDWLDRQFWVNVKKESISLPFKLKSKSIKIYKNSLEDFFKPLITTEKHIISTEENDLKFDHFLRDMLKCNGKKTFRTYFSHLIRQKLIISPSELLSIAEDMYNKLFGQKEEEIEGHKIGIGLGEINLSQFNTFAKDGKLQLGVPIGGVSPDGKTISLNADGHSTQFTGFIYHDVLYHGTIKLFAGKHYQQLAGQLHETLVSELGKFIEDPMNHLKNEFGEFEQFAKNQLFKLVDMECTPLFDYIEMSLRDYHRKHTTDPIDREKNNQMRDSIIKSWISQLCSPITLIENTNALGGLSGKVLKKSTSATKIKEYWNEFISLKSVQHQLRTKVFEEAGTSNNIPAILFRGGEIWPIHQLSISVLYHADQENGKQRIEKLLNSNSRQLKAEINSLHDASTELDRYYKALLIVAYIQSNSTSERESDKAYKQLKPLQDLFSPMSKDWIKYRTQHMGCCTLM